MIVIQDDLTYVDGVEAITFTPVGGAPVLVEHALRRKARESEAAASGGAYTAHDVKWFLSTVDLISRPTPGATITDAAGDVWTVLDVWPDALNAAWRCRARNLTFAEGLSQRVTILRAVWQASPAGAAAALWVSEHSDVPARIQPIETDVTTEHAQRMARATHRVYLGQSLALDANHRIVHAARVYHVLSTTMPARIDELPVVHVEVSPWPLK
jgi:head-tail adaptor